MTSAPRASTTTTPSPINGVNVTAVTITPVWSSSVTSFVRTLTRVPTVVIAPTAEVQANVILVLTA